MNIEELTGLPAGAVDHFGAMASRSSTRHRPRRSGGRDRRRNLVARFHRQRETMIAALSMLSAVERGGKALYIVPLRALASEKRRFEAYERFGVTTGVTTGNYESTSDWLSTKDIIVATSEKSRLTRAKRGRLAL